MHLTILAATGATGRELTRQALERGHTVTALVRHPDRVDPLEGPQLRVAVADVRNPESVRRAVHADSVVLSGLGIAKADKAGTLTAGARALVDAAPARILWLGAYGTGPSAAAAGVLTRTLLRFLGDELADKVAADSLVLEAGGTVFHAGPLTGGPISADRRTVALGAAPRRAFPARVTRGTVAAAMLDEAESPRFAAQLALPLPR